MGPCWAGIAASTISPTALDNLNRAVVDLSAKVDSKQPTQGTRLPRWDGPTWARLILPSRLIRDVGIVSQRSENL